MPEPARPTVDDNRQAVLAVRKYVCVHTFFTVSEEPAKGAAVRFCGGNLCPDVLFSSTGDLIGRKPSMRIMSARKHSLRSL